jgi:hypothetical protein
MAGGKWRARIRPQSDQLHFHLDSSLNGWAAPKQDGHDLGMGHANLLQSGALSTGCAALFLDQTLFNRGGAQASLRSLTGSLEQNR